MIHQTNYPPGFVLYASALFKLFSKRGTVQRNETHILIFLIGMIRNNIL